MLFNGGQKSRTPDPYSSVRETDLWQSANIGSEGNSGKAELARHILVKIQIEAMRIDAVIAQAEFVDQRWAERVHLAQGQAAIRVLIKTVGEVTAVQGIVERGGQKAGLVFVAEAREKIVGFRK